MNIAIICQSELLQKSLQMYLGNYIASLQDCDMVVSDYQVCDIKPVFIVGEGKEAHINKPFTKQDLLKKINSFYKTYCLSEPKSITPNNDNNALSKILRPRAALKPLSRRDEHILHSVNALVERTLLDFNEQLREIFSDISEHYDSSLPTIKQNKQETSKKTSIQHKPPIDELQKKQ